MCLTPVGHLRKVSLNGLYLDKRQKDQYTYGRPRVNTVEPVPPESRILVFLQHNERPSPWARGRKRKLKE